MGSRIREVRILHDHRVFRGSDTRRLQSELSGRFFRAAQACGKQMLFRFDRDGWLGVHLGMAGKLLRVPAGQYDSHKHDQLVLVTGRDRLVFRDTRTFGRIRWEISPDPPSWWVSAGPDLVSPDYKREDLESVLTKHSKTPLKSLLLDQRYFPGIGNWMADEILWRAALHPELTGRDLTDGQVKSLYRRLREVCRDALQVIAPDWSQPPRSWLFSHRWKDGGICPKTRKALERIQVGGRTTCYSPARQKKPSRSYPSRSLKVS